MGVLSLQSLKCSSFAFAPAFHIVGRSIHSHTSLSLIEIYWAFHPSCVQNIRKSILSNLHNGWAPLPLCIDLRPQLMQITLLLLLVAPLAGLAAPIEKPSSPYHLVNAEAVLFVLLVCSLAVDGLTRKIPPQARMCIPNFFTTNVPFCGSDEVKSDAVLTLCGHKQNHCATFGHTVGIRGFCFVHCF